MKPNKWQDDAAGFVYERDSSILLARTGTGKTLTYLLALNEWLQAKEIKRAIVTAPLRVCNTVWRQEAKKWGLPVRFALCTGEMSKRDQEAAIFAQDFSTDGPINLLVNHSMLPKVLKADHGADCLIIDELSLFRRPSGTWQRAARFAAYKGIRIRTGGTGTPAPNGLTSLYGMTQAVGCAHVFAPYGQGCGRNVSKWQQRFFYVENRHNPHSPLLPFADTPRELAEAIAPHTYTLEAGAVELPPIVHPPIELEVPAGIRRKYDEMRATSQLSDEDILADSAAIVRLKLRQILSGFAYDAAGEAVELEDDYRLDAIEEIIDEQNGEPLIVAYEYRAQLDMMRKRWPRLHWIGGGSTGDEQTIEDWNAGKISLLALHPYAAGHGLNLQYGGCAMAFWQMPDDLEARQQVVARLARRGQKSPNVYVYEPYCPGTIEDAIRARTLEKTATQETLWETLRR